MMKNLVRTPEDALLYLVDCSLATVSDMAMKKSKSKSEFKRQIAIAQTTVDWIVGFGILIEPKSRINAVIISGSVEKWSLKYI